MSVGSAELSLENKEGVAFCDLTFLINFGESNMSEERRLRITGTKKGLACPFKPVPCEEDYCSQCPIYHDWRRLGEYIVMCAWCGKVIGKKNGQGQSGISHGMCPECSAKEFEKERQ